MEGLVRVPVREQEPKVRATNFEEVCYGYNEEEAVAEASRCLNCKNAQCMKGCPVSINIPAFIAQVKERNFEEAYHIISESSALPAVCGRVCPQEIVCKCSSSSQRRKISARRKAPPINWCVKSSRIPNTFTSSACEDLRRNSLKRFQEVTKRLLRRVKIKAAAMPPFLFPKTPFLH